MPPGGRLENVTVKLVRRLLQPWSQGHRGGTEQPAFGLEERQGTDPPGGPGGAKKIFHRFAGEHGESGVKSTRLVRTNDDLQVTRFYLGHGHGQDHLADMVSRAAAALNRTVRLRNSCSTAMVTTKTPTAVMACRPLSLAIASPPHTNPTM